MSHVEVSGLNSPYLSIGTPFPSVCLYKIANGGKANIVKNNYCRLGDMPGIECEPNCP